MTSVTELTVGPAAHLVTPRPGFGVCRICFNLTGGYRLCWACAHGEQRLDAFAPISYSVSGGPLHAMLVDYKRAGHAAAPARTAQLAAILWRHLSRHERCLARAARIERFELVTTVPSSSRPRGEDHPLARIVGELVGPVRERHRQLLRRSTTPVPSRMFDARRFEAVGEVQGRAVLLIDDTWTTGASAQSAAAALKAAGARAVAAVVIGRYLNLEWQENEARLGALPRPIDWERCALEPRGVSKQRTITDG